MRPFLLLACRPEDAAGDDEYRAFLEYGGLEESQLHRIRMEAGPLPRIDLDRYSGIFLGGSPFNSSDPEETKSEVQRRVEAELGALLDEVVERDYPFLGACYGVGSLGRHQGAVIDRTYGETISAVEIKISKPGLTDPLLEGLPERFPAFVGHKEAVTTLPTHAAVLATSSSCPVQMFRIKRNLYATQFHPELDAQGILTRIDVYRNAGYFPPDQAEALMEQLRPLQVDIPQHILKRFVARYAR